MECSHCEQALIGATLMKVLVVLIALLTAASAHCLPRTEMDELIALMRAYARTPTGPFKFRIELESATTDVRYEKTRNGYRLALVFAEPVELVGFGKDPKAVQHDSIPVALIDFHADGILDDVRALYTKRTRMFSGPTTKRERQDYYDRALSKLRMELRRRVNPT